MDDDNTADSRRMARSVDQSEFYALLDCLMLDDELLLNKRSNALTVENVNEHEGKLGTNKTYSLSGNGTWYTLYVVECDDRAELQCPSYSEPVEMAKVVGRNPENIMAYDHLMTEEIESLNAPRHHWRDWRVEHEGEDLQTIKTALDLMISSDQMEGNTRRDIYFDWRALREQIRGFDSWEFVGHERGIIGAALDYAVEDERKPFNPDDEMCHRINVLRGVA